MKFVKHPILFTISTVIVAIGCILPQKLTAQNGREIQLINDGWRFFKGDPVESPKILYDVRPEIADHNDNVVADTKPTEGVKVNSSQDVLKPWILPAANEFIKDPSKYFIPPASPPVLYIPFAQLTYNESLWENVNLPHDWAIKGPFYKEVQATVGGGMGRLPVQGIGWYRKKIYIPVSDKEKKIYLDIDGAMSYAMIWCNGKLVGGWPYGYNSFRLDLTPFIKVGAQNQLAIRIDNPNHSARWYPGAGLYRNVWLVKTADIHVKHWGTYITTLQANEKEANIQLEVKVQNDGKQVEKLEVRTEIFSILSSGQKSNQKIASFKTSEVVLNANGASAIQSKAIITHPKLWGPIPNQQPNLYVAVTKIFCKGKLIDRYETPFGIRTIKFDPYTGISVNGKTIKIQGVNQHHDLGALGAAFNKRAAERQLQMLQEMGCNAIRLSHNPPAPELLDLTDRMGFLVIDEIFDSWERKKTPHDFHLIFPDWYEADLRSFIRRDRNHPSIIAWSFGNEVGEQYTGDTGAIIARKLHEIVQEEDDTRPSTTAMNYAKPYMPLPATVDFLGLNYQGEGIRDAPAYAHLNGIRTNPLYPAFHEKFPNKMIVSTETASALSTRGTYIFPVSSGKSAPVSDSTGGDPIAQKVSAYELYTAAFGASPDKVFESQDKHPYVAGEFVWTGWDYIGEPTPYYTARSSYSGIIDLAGFKKDRFYLYQSRWLPNKPMVHILPHWNWPDRIGKVTPVHIFTSGDEAELFLNGKSLGRKKKNMFEYRLRWDEVKFETGTLKVVAYKNGQKWATESIATTGKAVKISLKADRTTITADGKDLAFVTLTIEDANGNIVPDANINVSFSIKGAGEIVATDNGDPADLNVFSSLSRKTYAGYALAIIRASKNKSSNLTISASAHGLTTSTIKISTQ